MDKPLRLEDDAAGRFQLEAIAAELRASDEYASSGRTARTLARGPGLNVVLGVVGAGVVLGEHQAPGPATLLVLDGRVVFCGEAQDEIDLEARSTVAFAGGLRHSVRAVEDSAFLLVISG